MSSSSSSHQARPFSAQNPSPAFQADGRSPAFQGSQGKKRKRAEFELNFEKAGDVVSKGLVSYEDAELYFRAFFSGCVCVVVSSLLRLWELMGKC